MRLSRHHPKWLCYLLGPLLLAATPPLLAQGHRECRDCHIQGGTEGTAMATPLRHALPQLCIECHQEQGAAGEHRINLRPISAHPTTLPLLDGQVSCTSCHDPHAKGPMQLRLEASRLCLDCHRK